MSQSFKNYIENPYVLTFLTCLMWSGGSIAAIVAMQESSIFTMMLLRGLMAAAVLVLITRKTLISEWPICKANWPLMLLMSVSGFFIFNVFFYLSAQRTTGVNMAIIQGSSPIFMTVGAMIFFKARMPLLQWLGLAFSIFGIVFLALKGNLTSISQLSFNLGDLFMLIACLLFALYALLLKKRPPFTGLNFFTFVSLGSMLFIVPSFLIEYYLGFAQMPSTWKGWAAVMYMGLFTAAFSQVTYIKMIDKMGPARAGVATNLSPIIGVGLAILILGESFAIYHALAGVLVILGVILAEKGKSK